MTELISHLFILHRASAQKDLLAKLNLAGNCYRQKLRRVARTIIGGIDG